MESAHTSQYTKLCEEHNRYKNETAANLETQRRELELLRAFKADAQEWKKKLFGRLTLIHREAISGSAQTANTQVGFSGISSAPLACAILAGPAQLLPFAVVHADQ